jgi:hypothetical protein
MIQVISPTPPPPGRSLPTPQEIANSLATLPPAQLDSMHQIVLSPHPNPSDAYWAKQYHTPGFTSAATGGNGGVTYYPQGPGYWNRQEEVDRVMSHEGGHTYSGDLWRDPAKAQAWKDAMAKDGRSPSKYADNAPTEDFSESLAMYNLSKGSPCETFARVLFPNRYAYLDGQFAPRP